MSCPPAGLVEGQCCAISIPQTAPPLPPTLGLTLGSKDSCLHTDGLPVFQGPQDSAMEELSVQRKDRLPFQIFPEPFEGDLSREGTLACPPQKERLPSIVVEPTEVSEVESGELRWPPEDMDEEEDEDIFLEQCIPPANIADWGEEEDDDARGEEDDDDARDLHSEEEFRDETPTPLHDGASALN